MTRWRRNIRGGCRSGRGGFLGGSEHIESSTLAYCVPVVYFGFGQVNFYPAPVRLIRTAVGLLLLGSVFPGTGGAEGPDATAAARASLERFQGLRKERPGDGILIFYEANIRIALGQRDVALDLLRSLKGRHLGLIPVRDTGFDDVWGDPEFQKIRTELAEEESKTTDAPVAFRLTDPKLIPEGIAFDPGTGAFFLGSIAQHKIVFRDATGRVRDFSNPADKLDSVLGLVVDPKHEHLYA